jgi:osmoprotectant transport system permease protein
MRTSRRLVVALGTLAFVWLVGSASARADGGSVVVGSKKFTESYVLGEIAKKVLQDAGFTVTHRQGIGATGIVWTALKSGAITCYPEYTGTIGEEILKAKGAMSPDEMRTALMPFGVGMTSDLGFDDTYALVMRRRDAEQHGIKTISDLARQGAGLRVSLSNEFLERKDGWKPLSARYGLGVLQPKGIEHGLAYRALTAGQIDITDAYSTDAGIAENDFVVLKDDRRFFPQYRAVFLYRLGAPPGAIAALKKLEGTIDEAKMTRLNAEAEKTKDYAQAAALYFGKGAQVAAAKNADSLYAKIARWTLQHLVLVGISLGFAILVGLPLGIVASRPGWLSQFLLGVTGVIQTIPSLALFAFLVPVPFLGTGPATAIVALVLYSLLPIVRNTAAGMPSIPESLRDSAAALGLEPAARLWRVYLPMASRTILAGIKTSAIINVGTATIAALIGAGGLGEPIVSGLSLNDNATILQGAIPAAVLALLVQFLFDLLDRLLIPKGLRLGAGRD